MIDLKGADLSLLVSLDALIDEANVTKAAERLNISQPALSAQLARLRDLFHDPLLVSARGGRGMVLTPRALELKLPLHLALKDLETVVKRPSATCARTACVRSWCRVLLGGRPQASLGLPLGFPRASLGLPRPLCADMTWGRQATSRLWFTCSWNRWRSEQGARAR
jgi:DNA-binding transcriptional ArsR family regulator